jgi:hypothetical protein
MNEEERRERRFSNDVRRAIILGEYIRHWNMPKLRVESRKGDDKIEVYLFPGERVCRVATVGVSSLQREDGRKADWELLLVLPLDLAGSDFERVASFVMDVAAYSLEKDVQFSCGMAIPQTPLAPESWSARALLVDEPRGEDEGLEMIRVAEQQVQLLWLVPIHASEREAIVAKGVEAFDRSCEQQQCDLSEPRRPAVV